MLDSGKCLSSRHVILASYPVPITQCSSCICHFPASLSWLCSNSLSPKQSSPFELEPSVILLMAQLLANLLDLQKWLWNGFIWPVFPLHGIKNKQCLVVTVVNVVNQINLSSETLLSIKHTRTAIPSSENQSYESWSWRNKPRLLEACWNERYLVGMLTRLHWQRNE